MGAVIFLGLVVLWAAVLIPMWLRRHDEEEESRSVDRFTHAMHTLSRRETRSDKHYVVMPQRPQGRDVHISGASAERTRRSSRSSGPKRPLTAAQRRQRTLGVLLALTLLTLVLAVVIGGVATWGLQVIVDLCLVAFLAHLRRRARLAPARPVRRATPRRTPVEPSTARVAVPLPAEDDVAAFEPVPVRPPARAAEVLFDQMVAAESVDVPAVAALDDPVQPEPVVAAQAGAGQYVVAGRDADIDIDIDIAPSSPAADPQPVAAPAADIGARPWEPKPVPKPVYATKPAARPRRRPAPAFEPLLPPADRPEEISPDELEEILDRRWAVND